MIDRYSVAGYRSFYARADVELRPLTLVYGRNSSGKSALVRALPLLHASLNSRSPQPLDLSAAVVRGVPYSELASLGHDRLMHWTIASREVVVEATIRDLSPPAGTEVVDRLLLRAGDREIEVTWDGATPGAYELREGEARRSVQLRFTGILARQDILSEFEPALSPIIDTEVEWLSAKRDAPRVTVEPYATAIGEHEGANARILLALDRKRGGRLFTWVDEQLRTITGHRLEISEAGAPIEGFSLRTGMGDHGPAVRLVNTGEGVAHVLPVLVAVGRAVFDPGQRLAVIEQPELLLHPRAVADLGGVFAEVAQGASTDRFLVETHSDNLLLGVQLAIAQGRVDPARVGLHIVEQDENGHSTVRRGDFDARGSIDTGLRRPFEEGTELARKLVETRLGMPLADASSAKVGGVVPGHRFPKTNRAFSRRSIS